MATLPTSETRGKFKVSDFGLACETARRMTATGNEGLKEQCLPRSFMHIVGETRRTNERTDIVALTGYAAPEVFSAGGYDYTAEVYTISMVLKHILEGERVRRFPTPGALQDWLR